MDRYEPAGGGTHPALILLHGSGGAARFWLERVAPLLVQRGVAVYAPHYFDKTATQRATAEMILDGRHSLLWLTAIRDGFTHVADRPNVVRERIAVLGVSLGGFLAVALAAEGVGLRAVVELSGGVPRGWEDRITSAMPPVLVMHGIEDNVVPVTEARKLAALLEQRGVPHEVELLPGETHWFSARAQLTLLMRCGAFLGRYL